MSRRKKKSKQELSAAIRGEERRIHFADKKSARMWIGTSSVHKNRKDKRKNRKNIKLNAIKDNDGEKE